MSDSFQNEIPKARVNITLDVDTNEGRKKKELPLKLLVMGDFSHGKTTGPVAERQRLDVNKTNFDKVMHDLAPELHYVVPNRVRNDGSEMRVDLTFDSMKQFHPEEIIKQIPELRNLLAMRNLLKDLKANVLDNATLRRELEKLVKDQVEMQRLQGQLKALSQNTVEEN
ncbi:MAG: type VI secretion system contractile sheath small subunit [Coxiellaceae bacterium]|nr:MAG: type VI secretion system contractile sheath small subunit [Coxiellaceae bacterium]